MGQDMGSAHVGVGVEFGTRGRSRRASRCGGGGRAVALVPSVPATVVKGIRRGDGDNARGPRPRTRIWPNGLEVGGPAHTLRIFQTLIHSYIFSGMVHLGD